MVESHRETLSIILTLIIVFMAGFVIHVFLPSLIWAVIISIATYPLYRRWRRLLGKQSSIASLFFTFFIAIAIILPIYWLLTVLVQETQIFINHLMWLNHHGQAVPSPLANLPFIGDEISRYWQKHFSKPGGLKPWLSSLHLSLTPFSYYIKKVGLSLAHRSVQVGFTLLSLFFFYRDGEKLGHEVNMVGQACLGHRFERYASRLPSTIRATVNGTIFVGLGVGCIMGGCYWLLGFPAPTLAGFFTAIAAMIPFVVPVVFIIVALVLWLSGSLIAALVLLLIGTLVMFIADHFVKPALIGGSTKLPFLLVLFGILGGVETLGILGLFLGPIIMVMFMILWKELQQPTVLPVGSK